ncbi:MAG: zinc ribbon domain-containing protein [Actinomycetota bacterium]|nr:zinc ribbon domain-containing protein [Actinomycetota bacterium]
MPIYEYRCENGHTFEVLQRMSDDRISVCQTCDAPVQQVFHPIAVHFKGSGFYNTDYGTRNRSRETEAAAAKDGADKAGAKSDDKKKPGETSGEKSGEKAGTTASTGDKSGASKSTNGKGGSTSAKKSET